MQLLFLFICLKPTLYTVRFLYRPSTSEAFIPAKAYSPWEILQEKWTILAFTTDLRYLAGGSCLKPGEDQIPEGFTISNLNLHYLFRQEYPAGGVAYQSPWLSSLVWSFPTVKSVPFG